MAIMLKEPDAIRKQTHSGHFLTDASRMAIFAVVALL